ncbi:hypothetical protein E2562_023377 [Oryza meyeriana var. granulata]|uniref:Uncharacterized protein n=1 Tax=Oryza meyeriana var. granulata TaxID=110450 RepID=A0A6G1E2Y4_9ORYZ|nr:hypothetical protein E2562_023377 [Oryza meyeriana var. granulata]
MREGRRESLEPKESEAGKTGQLRELPIVFSRRPRTQEHNPFREMGQIAVLEGLSSHEAPKQAITAPA